MSWGKFSVYQGFTFKELFSPKITLIHLNKLQLIDSVFSVLQIAIQFLKTYLLSVELQCYYLTVSIYVCALGTYTFIVAINIFQDLRLFL